MNIKYIFSLAMLIALTGASCWGAAAPTGNPEADVQLINAIVDSNIKAIIAPTGASCWGAAAPMGNPEANVQLINAIGDSNIEAILVALQNGASANAVDSIGNPAIICATRAKYSEPIIKILLDHGANVNSHNAFWDTPLMYAAEHDNASLAQLLLDHGADPRLKNSNRKTALNIAESMQFRDEQIWGVQGVQRNVIPILRNWESMGG